MSSSLRVNTIVPSTGTNVAIGTANGTVTFTDSVNFVLGTGSSIFSPASNTLTFGTNDAERLRITSDGKIGINQASPGAMLQVDYDEGSSEVGLRLRAYNASGSKTWQLSEVNGNAGVFSIRNATNSTEGLDIHGDGHVRVPSGDLRVGDNTDSNAGTKTISVGSVSSGSGGIGIFANPTNGNSWVQFGDGTSSSSQYRGYMNYQHADDSLRFGTASTERLRIDSSGRIAQGGKTPSSHGSPNLLIWGSDPTVHLSSTGSTNNSSFTGIKFAVAGGSTGDYSKAGIFVQRQSSYNDLDMIFAFRSSNDATGVSVSDEKIRINSDGQLNVNQANNNNLMGQVTIFEGTDFNTGSQLGRDNIYLISDQTSANGGYGASIAFSRIQYSDRRAAAIVTKQTTADEDQVGLAFFTHSSTDAAANIVESLVLTHDGNLTATGNVTAFSDVTLKENIETIPNALDKVLNLRGVGFNRVDKEDNPREIGVIAQEVEEIIPEVVHTNTEGIKSVAYGNLVGLLIESIKELKAEVNDLKAQLEG